MILKLTNREKVLLVILALVTGVFLALLFIIQPSVEKLIEAQGRLDEVKQTKGEMVAKIGSLEATESDIFSIGEEMDSILETYLPVKENYELEALITDIVVSHGMMPARLLISGAPVPIHPTGSRDAEPTGIVKAQVSVSVEGTLDSLAELIGFAEQYKYLQIASFAVGSDTGQTEISLDFEVLMYENFEE